MPRQKENPVPKITLDGNEEPPIDSQSRRSRKGKESSASSRSTSPNFSAASTSNTGTTLQINDEDDEFVSPSGSNTSLKSSRRGGNTRRNSLPGSKSQEKLVATSKTGTSTANAKNKDIDPGIFNAIQSCITDCTGRWEKRMDDFTVSLQQIGSNQKQFEAKYERRMKSMEAKQVDLETRYVNLQKEMTAMAKEHVEFRALKQKVSTLENFVDDLQQTNRNKNIIVHGLAREYNSIEGFTEFTRKKLRIPQSDIHISYVVELKKKDSEEYLLKVAFATVHDRMLVYKGRTQLTVDDEIWLRDDLTQRKSKLAFEARQKVRSTDVQKTWTYLGEIYVLHHTSVNPIHITKIDELEQF